MPSKLNTRNFLYKKKNICRSISAAPLHKWPISIVLLTLGILELFRVGSLPNPTQGIFDYDLAKGAWKIERPLLLLYNFCHSQKFLVLNLEEVPLEKFSNLSNRTERGPFMIPYRVERQKWSGKYFFLMSKIPCLEFGRYPARKFGNFSNATERGHFTISYQVERQK